MKSTNSISKSPVSKSSVSEIDITDLSHDGRGVGRESTASGSEATGAAKNAKTKRVKTKNANTKNAKKAGKACFVSGALPGERVTWKKLNSKSSFDEGVLLEVLEASADRVEPRCGYYQNCGGCELQHLSADAQLVWKEQQLRSTLERASIEFEHWLPALSAESWGYRRRSRLAVEYQRNGRISVGFREKNSRKLVGIDRCEVLDERLNPLLPELEQIAAKLKNYGLTQIELTAADHQLALCFYVRKPIDASLLAELSLSAQKPEQQQPVQLWQRLPGEPAMPLAGGYRPLTTVLTENTDIAFKPGQFVQVNDAMNRAMIEQALALASPDSSSRVLDLFCGAGNFSLAFAQHCQHLIGVEGSAELCRQASENAQSAGNENLEFRVVDLDKPEQFKLMAAGQVDLVILDPPRSGAASLVPWLTRLSAEKILYVSCHPATMVRDIQGLATHYRLQSVGVMDMFPHTAHIEAMAMLVRI